MPKMICSCQETLSYGEIPNPIEWLIISDAAFDKFSGQVDSETIYQAMTSLLRCPNCGRLWVFWEGFQSPPQEFVPTAKSQVDDHQQNVADYRKLLTLSDELRKMAETRLQELEPVK